MAAVNPKNPLRRAIERAFVRSVAASIAALMRRLPLSWGRRLGNVLGTILYVCTPQRQRLAADNLEAVFGDRFTPEERRAISLRVSRNMAKVFLELFKLPSLDADTLKRLMPLDGADVVRRALERGKGAILLTAHFGNWELLGARLAAEGFPVAVVARDASDASTASIINRSREQAGLHVFGRDDLRGMVRHLRDNGCLGILPDQHTQVGSVHMIFLGRPAWVARGPAMLALRTGCALIPAFCVREADDSLHGYVREEIICEATGDREEDVRATMEKVNRVLEDEIRQRPDHWLWLHNRWKEMAPPES